MSYKPVTVARFAESAHANVGLGLLQSNGIEAHLADANTVGMHWGLNTAVGGIRLLVNPVDEEKALALLGAEDPTPGLSIIVETDLEDEQESDALELSPRDNTGRRAFKAGIIGLALTPLLLYSLYLGIEALTMEGEISDRVKWRLVFVMILDVLVIGLFARVVMLLS